MSKAKVKISLASLACCIAGVVFWFAFPLTFLAKKELYPDDFDLMFENKKIIHYMPHFFLIDVAILMIAGITGSILALCFNRQSEPESEQIMHQANFILAIIDFVIGAPVVLADAGLMAIAHSVPVVLISTPVIFGILYRIIDNKPKVQNVDC